MMTSWTKVVTNEIEKSGQICDLLEVEWVVIVHTMVDCEEMKVKEGADTCIK